MAHLAQTYIHLKPYTLRSEDLAQLGRAAEEIARNAALRIYTRDTELDVRLEEGSLKVWLTVAGTLMLGTYGFVANYKGFKEGITELCQDARSFGFDVCGPFIREARASPEQVYRVEKRLKTPGRIDRAVRLLERLDANNGQTLSSNDRQRLFSTLRQEIEAIERDLDPGEASKVRLALRLDSLPPMSDWPKLPPPHMPRIALRNDAWVESIPQDYGALEGYLTPRDQQRSRLTYHNRVVVRSRPQW